MQLQTISLEEHPISLSSLTYGNKYESRVDLTAEVRTKIGFIASFSKAYGHMTRLSERYDISRTTVYAIRDRFNHMVLEGFGKPTAVITDKIATREGAIRQMVLLRLTGQSSLSGIATILKENGHSHNSVGFISQTLNLIGDKLPQVIDYQGVMAWACDEIYHLGSVPILITVEPISGFNCSRTNTQTEFDIIWIIHSVSIGIQVVK